MHIDNLNVVFELVDQIATHNKSYPHPFIQAAYHAFLERYPKPKTDDELLFMFDWAGTLISTILRIDPDQKAN